MPSTSRRAQELPKPCAKLGALRSRRRPAQKKAFLLWKTEVIRMPVVRCPQHEHFAPARPMPRAVQEKRAKVWVSRKIEETEREQRRDQTSCALSDSRMRARSRQRKLKGKGQPDASENRRARVSLMHAKTEGQGSA